MADFQGDGEQAVPLLEHALALFRTLQDQQGIGYALTHLGLIANDRADHAAAAARQEEALAAFRLAEHREGTADALNNLGAVSFELQQFDRAVELWEASLELNRAMDRKHNFAGALVNLGIVAHDRGDDVQSVMRLEEALQLLCELDMKYAAAICLQGLARVAPAQAESACTLLGLADGLRQEIGAYGPSHLLPGYERLIANLRNTLGEAAFAMAWETGHTMSLGEALDIAGALVAATKERSLKAGPRPAEAHGLTARELEVLRLIAAGHLSREVSELLFISTATVARHLTNIYRKLGVDSRAKLTAFALRHDLV